MSVTLINRLCRRFEEYRCQYCRSCNRKSTREHLPYMTVSLKGTTIGTMTDATGHYFLKNLPEGEFTLSVSAVGYKSQERKVVLKRGKTLEENFELEEDMVALDGW